MKEFIEKLIGRLEEEKEGYSDTTYYALGVGSAIKIVNQLVEEYKPKQLSRYATTDFIVDDEYCWQKCCSTEMCGECKRLHNGSIDYFDSLDDCAEKNSSKSRGLENNGWICVEDELPKSKNGSDWVSCIVSVMRNHYPTSTYDVCDSPYDETLVMHADYNVSQKIWHLDCDEQLNALIDVEDDPLNGDYVIAWMPLPEPYKESEG